MDDLLQGAIDAHVHSGPDVVPRRLDDFDLVQDAKRVGLGGLVLKSHIFPTVARAHVASRITGLRVWGGIALNLSVGGWNPWAVRASLAMGGKTVWMPTVHARHMLKDAKVAAYFGDLLPPLEQALSPLDDRGEILSEVLDILDLIAGADAVLATGHLAPQESMALVQEANSRGVKRIILTHPLSPIIGFTLEEVTGLISQVPMLWVEFTAFDLTKGLWDDFRPAQLARWIQEIGPERVILTSDGGQSTNPPPHEMLADMLKALRDQGLPLAALKSMVVDNPLALLE